MKQARIKPYFGNWVIETGCEFFPLFGPYKTKKQAVADMNRINNNRNDNMRTGQ